MSSFSDQIQGRSHIQFFLRWRWLVLVISVPVTLAVEVLEMHTFDVRFLTEVFIDGLITPLATWFLFTFAAQSMDRQYEREEILQRRQQFLQRLTEHRTYRELADYIVHFPATFLPIEHSSLYLANHDHSRFNFIAEWSAPSIDSLERHNLPVLVSPTSDIPLHEYRLILLHEQVQIGILWLRAQKGKAPTADQLGFITSLLPQMAMALAGAIADSQQRQRVYRQAQAYERRRLTQELHDSLAQQVFYLHLGLDQLAGNQALIADDSIQRKITSMRDVAANVYEQIRNNLSILRTWEQINLTEAISELARVTAHTASITIDIDVYGEPSWLSPHTCEHIYSVVREGMNNVVKHARADDVQLQLLWTADHLTIILSDNGIGFDRADVPDHGHYGLTLMRESIEELQGVFSFESALGSGTRLHIKVPLRLPVSYMEQHNTWDRVSHSMTDVDF